MNLDERVSLTKKNIIMIKKIMRDHNSATDRAIKEFNTDYALNLWAGNQRRFIVIGVLSDEEVEVYREQNFDFGIRPLKWDEWFMLIKEYCEIHGVNEVPAHTFSEEGYALDVWFNRQLRNRRKLTPDQFERIESIKPSERKAYVIKFNGKIFHSAKEFSSFTNIPYNIVCNCASIGMSGEEIIVFCKTILLGEKIVFKGREFENLRDFSDYYSVPIYKWLTELQEFAIVQNPEGNSKKELIAQKGRPKRSFSYNGQEFNNSKEFAEKFGIPYHFARACFQEGMTGEEVIKQYWEKEFENAFKRYFQPGRKIHYDGQLFVNTRVFADYYGISFSSARTYFRLGYTPQEVIEKCKQGRIREQVEGVHVVFKGKEYISIRKFADENNLDYAYTQSLLREGHSPEEIVKIQYGELLVAKTKNNLSQFEGTHIEFKGKDYISIRQFVDDNGLDYAHTQTLRRKGYTPEEIVKIHRGELTVEKDKEYKFYHKGEGYVSYSEFAKTYSIPYGRLRLLLKEGFNLDQILEINERGFRRGLKKDSVIDYDGHIFFDVYDFSSHYGLDYFYAVIRLSSGWSYDELINPDYYKANEKEKKKRVAISIKNIRKWEMSNRIDDQVLLAYVYYNGRVVQKDYKRAIGILEKICTYAPAKLLLARCYLHLNDKNNSNAKKALQLIYEYNDETLENSIQGQGYTGLIDSIIPDLANAYSKILEHDKGDIIVLESVKYFAEALGDIRALCCLYEYYSDVSNFYYDIEEAKKYETLIDDAELINNIRKDNPYCIRTSIYKNGGESYSRLLLLYAYPKGIENLDINKQKRVRRKADKEFDSIEEDWEFSDIIPDTYIEEHFSKEVSEILIYEY